MKSIPFLKKESSGQLSHEAHAGLVIAHPGHELCIFGWLQEVRPHVFILTDGSGRDAQPKLESTRELLAHLNVPGGEIFGRLSDTTIYRAILDGNARIFSDLAAELADIFTRRRFDYVVCEAVEGYNPTHDLCRFITEAALIRANRMSEHQTVGYEVDLIRRTCSNGEAPQNNSIWLRLDDQMLREKTQTMRAHPHLKDEVSAGLDGVLIPALHKYPQLTAELKSRVDNMGPEAFRVEHLRRLKVETMEMTGEAPFYERYGEILVRTGRYERAIRYGEHIVPIVETLRHFAQADRAAARSNC